MKIVLIIFQSFTTIFFVQFSWKIYFNLLYYFFVVKEDINEYLFKNFLHKIKPERFFSWFVLRQLFRKVPTSTTYKNLLKMHHVNICIIFYCTPPKNRKNRIIIHIFVYMLEKHHYTNKSKVSRSNEFIYGFLLHCYSFE